MSGLSGLAGSIVVLVVSGYPRGLSAPAIPSGVYTVGSVDLAATPATRAAKAPAIAIRSDTSDLDWSGVWRRMILDTVGVTAVANPRTRVQKVLVLKIDRMALDV